VVLMVNGKPVSTVPQLLSQVAALKPGVQAELEISRNKTDMTLQVVPGLRNPMPRTAE
jgi:S1-C subfamily serine protease